MLKTPDPITTTEQIPALLAVLVPAVVVLFKLDLSDQQQGAAIVILGAVYSAFTFWHAAKVRSARATGNRTTPTPVVTMTTSSGIPTITGSTLTPAVETPPRAPRRKKNTP
jgi:hypothetical protein